MARTRADVTPDAKRDAIVEVALRRFSQVGYDETPMASVARGAGVSVNTVYWYFGSKDVLLVEVAERLRTRPTRHVLTEDTSLADLLFGASNAFDEVGKIVTAVHARAQVSDVVKAWHLRYHEQAERLLMKFASLHLGRQGLPGLPESALQSLARLWVYALDGITTHDVPDSDRRLLCDEMVAQLDRAAREHLQITVAPPSATSSMPLT